MVLTLNSAKNFSSSLLVGRVNSNTRLGSATFGTIADMGLICAVGEGTNFRAFKVHAFDAEDSVFVGGNMFVIDPADSTVPFTNSGTPNVAAINKIQLSTRAATGALLTPLQTSTWYRVGKVIAAGGSAAVPTNFLEFAKDVCNAFVSPLAEITGNSAMVYAPMQIGGGDPCHISWNACLMQFPASSKTRPKAVRGHFSEGRLGISFNPIASDTVHITNAVFSSLTKFHFSILNTASASADWSLLGITLVNAIVTLRTVTTFDEFTFIDSDITQNGATVNNASLSGCYVTSDAPSELVGCSFISSGSGHAIEITTPGSYTLVNQQYSGYGANDTDDAVFYNNSGGTVTLSVSGEIPYC